MKLLSALSILSLVLSVSAGDKETYHRTRVLKARQDATSITGPGTLPEVTDFVSRDGTSLNLNGTQFRITGTNAYWLGIDENGDGATSSDPKAPSKQRINEVMAMTTAMGGNTIRAISIGNQLGKPVTILPDLGNWNEEAFDTIDYSIFAAQTYGLRLIVPLSDNYKYYHGGKYTYLGWRGAGEDNNGAAFYTNDQVKSDFKDYINHVLSHVNSYTGRALKDEPAILAWQIGNELGGWMGQEGFPPSEFTSEIAKYIKGIDSQHLIAAPEANTNTASGEAAPSLSIEEIDLIDEHLYPLDVDQLKKGLEATKNANKVYYVGEVDWAKDSGKGNIDEHIKALNDDGNAGSMVWSLFGHDSNCGDYVKHDDGYSIYYPDGNPQEEQARILKFVQQFYTLTGRNPPQSLPGVQCQQPTLDAPKSN